MSKNGAATDALKKALVARGVDFSAAACEIRDHDRYIAVLVHFGDDAWFDRLFALRVAGQISNKEFDDVADTVRAERELALMASRSAAKSC
jgi:hypothetical protein